MRENGPRSGIFSPKNIFISLQSILYSYCRKFSFFDWSKKSFENPAIYIVPLFGKILLLFCISQKYTTFAAQYEFCCTVIHITLSTFMAVKIRLSRHGRKNHPFYHIVVADSRAPRDGRFIERIGSYNPMTDPATIDIDIDRSLYWLGCGAQPTLTVRNILSYKGVLLKKHLLGGVAKNAFTLEEAERRFAAWVQDKEAKIEAKKQDISNKQKSAEKSRLEAESKVSEARAAAIRKKREEESAALAEKAKEAAAEAEAASTEETPQA